MLLPSLIGQSCRNKHQPSRGIETTDERRRIARYPAGININPVAGLKQRIVTAAGALR